MRAYCISFKIFTDPKIRELTLSWRRPLSYRNQSIDLPRKSMDWFLYDNGLRHERVKYHWIFFAAIFLFPISGKSILSKKFWEIFHKNYHNISPLSDKRTKWSNTLKLFVIAWVCLTILWDWHLKGKACQFKHVKYVSVLRRRTHLYC